MVLTSSCNGAALLKHRAAPLGYFSPVKGTENSSVSESLKLGPSGKVEDFALNQLPVCVEIIRPSSTPNPGRRLSRKTLATSPAPVSWLTD